MEPFSKCEAEKFLRSRGLYIMQPRDLDCFVECGVDAFLHYGMYIYFFEHVEFRKNLRRVIRAVLKANPESVVYADSEEVNGIAQWFGPGFRGTSILRYVLSGGWKFFLQKNGALTVRRMDDFEAFSFQRKREITDDEEIYLYNLGVRHSSQGKGIARKLVSPMVEYARSLGRVAYLETFTEKNVPIYEHLGFELQSPQIVPGSPLTHYPLRAR